MSMRKFEDEMERLKAERHLEMLMTVKIERKGCYNTSQLMDLHQLKDNITKKDFLRLVWKGKITFIAKTNIFF